MLQETTLEGESYKNFLSFLYTGKYSPRLIFAPFALDVSEQI